MEPYLQGIIIIIVYFKRIHIFYFTTMCPYKFHRIMFFENLRLFTLWYNIIIIIMS